MITGSTYPIDIISRSPLDWSEKWFDSGTGRLEIREWGILLKEFDLDIYRVSDAPGRYRIFYTMPDADTITVQATGTVDSLPMRTGSMEIKLQKG